MSAKKTAKTRDPKATKLDEGPVRPNRTDQETQRGFRFCSCDCRSDST